jgi:hypothetical protein
MLGNLKFLAIPTQNTCLYTVWYKAQAANLFGILRVVGGHRAGELAVDRIRQSQYSHTSGQFAMHEASGLFLGQACRTGA